ncbi:hypothetical protein PMAC_002862 [Pneumocystis sp. 'macacae']|nr:hypothetical protein PMAC_002862 [Pneumocystis sp. 'macacae']
MTRTQLENMHVYASFSSIDNDKSLSLLSRRHEYSNATHTVHNSVFTSTTETERGIIKTWSTTATRPEISTTTGPKIDVSPASVNSTGHSRHIVMPSFIISAISTFFDWRVMTIVVVSLWIALCFSVYTLFRLRKQVQREIYMAEKNDSEDTFNIYKAFWRNHRESRLANQHAANQYFLNP